jgi:hypothetical protein
MLGIAETYRGNPATTKPEKERLKGLSSDECINYAISPRRISRRPLSLCPIMSGKSMFGELQIGARSAI